MANYYQKWLVVTGSMFKVDGSRFYVHYYLSCNPVILAKTPRNGGETHPTISAGPCPLAINIPHLMFHFEVACRGKEIPSSLPRKGGRCDQMC